MTKKIILFLSTTSLSIYAKAYQKLNPCKLSNEDKICYSHPSPQNNSTIVIDDHKIELPDGTFLYHNFTGKDEAADEIKKLFANAEHSIIEEPLLMAAWTEHDGDEPE